MKLNEGMLKLLNLTSKFNSTLNLNNFINIRVPGNKLAELMGWEDGEGINSIGDLRDAVEDTGALVATGANIVNCAFTMNNVDGWSNLLGSMAMGVTSVIVQITDEIWNAIACQINLAAQQVINTFTNIVSALHSVVISCVAIWEAIKGLDDWVNKVEWNLDLELAKENCADMYAAIGGCLLNKFLGPYLDEFKEKALKEINEAGREFNDILYNELSDANTFAAYSEHEAFLLKKSSLQIKGLTRQNLLGV